MMQRGAHCAARTLTWSSAQHEITEPRNCHRTTRAEQMRTYGNPMSERSSAIPHLQPVGIVPAQAQPAAKALRDLFSAAERCCHLGSQAVYANFEKSTGQRPVAMSSSTAPSTQLQARHGSLPAETGGHPTWQNALRRLLQSAHHTSTHSLSVVSKSARDWRIRQMTTS